MIYCVRFWGEVPKADLASACWLRRFLKDSPEPRKEEIVALSLAQIEAAADDWMKKPRHYFRRDIGPRKARTKFVGDATNWLRFLGRLKEPECSPVPYADLVAEFCTFLERERELSPASIRIRRHDALRFLAWFEQQHLPFNEVTVRDVEKFLALPRSGPWSRVTIAGCVASLRSFFR